MHPGARIQAAIDLIDAVEQSIQANGAAADQLVQRYFRARRYAGSKDRRSVTDMVYNILRRRGELVWRFGEANSVVTARLLVFLFVLLDEGTVDGLDFSDSGAHGPAALSDEERTAVALANNVNAPVPDWARFNYPEWLDTLLRAVLGSQFTEEMEAMQTRAPLDLRINAERPGSDNPAVSFPNAVPGRWSPWALRLETATSVQQHPSYLAGKVEIQDEGSQIAALMVGAKPGDQILDLCAGAGGKTLAMAAQMRSTGQLYVYDTDAKRLDILRERASRSKAKNIQYVKEIDKFSNPVNKVVLDVPCSGSGTWRRNPELRWRITPDRLTELTALQKRLLDQGAGLVKQGGQLIYITCSILSAECEDQIAEFLVRQTGFTLVPYVKNWPASKDVGGRAPPPTNSTNPDCLRMGAHIHQTDGFFIAVLQRNN